MRPRTCARLGSSIVAAALIIAAVIAITRLGTTATARTVPYVSTFVVTKTVTSLSTNLAGPSTLPNVTTITEVDTSTVTIPAGGRLYEVIFKQSGDCYPVVFAAPWSVTFGPWTVTEPSNATLPIDTTEGSAGPGYANYTTIVFSVPDGQYNYSVSMGWNVGNPTGAMNVNGADTMITVQGPLVSCVIWAATTSS